MSSLLLPVLHGASSLSSGMLRGRTHQTFLRNVDGGVCTSLELPAMRPVRDASSGSHSPQSTDRRMSINQYGYLSPHSGDGMRSDNTASSNPHPEAGLLANTDIGDHIPEGYLVGNNVTHTNLRYAFQWNTWYIVTDQ
jgi:hypothetical protein